MIQLLNPKAFIKRAVINDSKGIICLTVEYNNGLIKSEYGFNTIGGAKKYFAKHYVCFDENIWQNVTEVQSVITKRKRGRPKLNQEN